MMLQTTRTYGRDDVDYATWYSPYVKGLAKNYTRAELERQLGGASSEAARAGRSHLRAIEATGSMGGQSQRRAHARNSVAAAGDQAIALRGALEIYDLFPEHTAESVVTVPRDLLTEALESLCDLITAIEIHDADGRPLAAPQRMPAIRLACALAQAGLALREEVSPRADPSGVYRVQGHAVNAYDAVLAQGADGEADHA